MRFYNLRTQLRKVDSAEEIDKLHFFISPDQKELWIIKKGVPNVPTSKE